MPPTLRGGWAGSKHPNTSSLAEASFGAGSAPHDTAVLVLDPALLVLDPVLVLDPAVLVLDPAVLVLDPAVVVLCPAVLILEHAYSWISRDVHGYQCIPVVHHLCWASY
jgi:hypothetical protein